MTDVERDRGEVEVEALIGKEFDGDASEAKRR